MSAQVLADRCAHLGHPLARSVIAKLEKGHRQSVTVADVLVLARALGVPPLVLMLPIGAEETTELLPDQKVPTWASARWITGEGRFPADDPPWDDPERGTQERRDGPSGLALIVIHREHDGLVERLLSLTHRLDAERVSAAVAKTDGGQAEAAADRLYAAERVLAQHRRYHMRERGVTPPPLPEALRYVDRIEVDS